MLVTDALCRVAPLARVICTQRSLLRLYLLAEACFNHRQNRLDLWMGFANLSECLEVDLSLLVRVDIAEVGQPLQLILNSLHRRRLDRRLNSFLASVVSWLLVRLLTRVGAVFGD